MSTHKVRHVVKKAYTPLDMWYVFTTCSRLRAGGVNPSLVRVCIILSPLPTALEVTGKIEAHSLWDLDSACLYWTWSTYMLMSRYNWVPHAYQSYISWAISLTFVNVRYYISVSILSPLRLFQQCPYPSAAYSTSFGLSVAFYSRIACLFCLMMQNLIKGKAHRCSV